MTTITEAPSTPNLEQATKTVAVRCSFAYESGSLKGRCKKVITGPLVPLVASAYVEHWRGLHLQGPKDVPPSRRLRQEVSDSYNAGTTVDQLEAEISAEAPGARAAVTDLGARLEEAPTSTAGPGLGIMRIPLDQVELSRYQVIQREADTVLTADILENGQQIPAIGRWHPEKPGIIELGPGQRRLDALRKIRVSRQKPDLTILVEVRDLTDSELVGLIIAENNARKDLSSLERARQAKQLLTLSGGKLKQKEVGAMVGVDEPTISNWLKCLASTPGDVLKLVEDGVVAWSALRPLLPLSADGGKGCRHEEDFRRVVARAMPYSVSPKHKGPAVTEENTAGGIKQRLVGAHTNSANEPPMAKWRPLDEKARQVYEKAYHSAPPIDQAAYEAKAPGQIHDFGNLGVWACNVSLWHKLADAARNADPKAAKKPERPASSRSSRNEIPKVEPEKVKTILAAEAARLRSTLGAKAAGKTDAQVLGDVAKVVLAFNASHNLEGFNIPDEVREYIKDVPVGKAFYQYSYNSEEVAVLSQLTPYMPAEEAKACETCVTGRRMAVLPGSSKPVPVCVDMRSLGKKLAAGAKGRDVEGEKRIARDRQAFDVAKRAIATGLLSERRGLVALASTMAMRLLRDPLQSGRDPVFRLNIPVHKVGWGYQDEFGHRIQSDKAIKLADVVAALQKLEVDELTEFVGDLLIASIDDHNEGRFYKGPPRELLELLAPAKSAT